MWPINSAPTAPFADFKPVHARKPLLHGAKLIFDGRGAPLHVVVAKACVARTLLRIRPPELPLSPAAAALRGSGARTGPADGTR